MSFASRFGRLIPVSVSVRLTLSLLACTGVLCDVGASSALAAGPQRPVTEAATAVTANAAVLHGELNPSASGKAGWYFAYAPVLVIFRARVKEKWKARV
jgi:hypothetical protein